MSSKKFLNGFDKRFIREMFYVPCYKQGVAMFRNLIKFFIGRVCKRYIRNRRHDIQRMRADKLQDNIDLVWLKAELGAMQNRLVFREDTLVNAELQFPAQNRLKICAGLPEGDSKAETRIFVSKTTSMA